MIKFVGLIKSSKMKKLGLCGLNLEDEGAVSVMHLLKESNLTHIDLSYNELSSNGFEGICV